MTILRQPSALQIMTEQKELEHAQYFNYLCNNTTNYASKSSIQQEQSSFHQQIGLRFKEESSEVHSIVWY